MSNTSALRMFSAGDAKVRFGELLNEALGQPVGITRHDKLTAYVVSKDEFENMLATIEYLQDQLWLAKADAARKSGFVGEEQTKEILHSIQETASNAKTGDNK